MFEVFDIHTGEVVVTRSTEREAWIQYESFAPEDFDLRIAEGRWPEYESVMEMEKYQ